MKNAKQLLLPTFSKTSNSFGGLMHGRRKGIRPIAIKHPMHLVIKSSSAIFLKNLKAHRLAVKTYAKNFHVKIYGLAFNGNHVHIVFFVRDREHYKSFIRTLSGAIARIAAKPKVFLGRPFTRIISWGKDFRGQFSYLHLNTLEADGISRATGRKLILSWDKDTG